MEKIPRIHIENALYYGTSRGDNEENIFKDAADYRMYLELLKKYRQQFGFKLFSFVLLPNHVHLLIEPKPETTISQIMHALNSNYTKYFNSRYGRKGHLLQERPKMAIVEKQKYLLCLSVYIHKNPSALGKDEAGTYEYSSYPLFTGIGTAALMDMEGERKEVEALLSRAGQLKGYAEYLKAVPASEMELLEKELAKKNILGSEEFIQRIRLAAGEEKHSVVQAPGILPSRFAFAPRVIIVVLCVFAAALAAVHMGLRQRLKMLSHAKEMEYSAKLEKDREFIKKDMQELYRADLVSYQAMQKRLEIEKNKVKELETRVKNTQKENP